MQLVLQCRCVLFEIINIDLAGKSFVGILCSVNLPFWRWTRNSLGELLVGRGGCSMSLLSFSSLVFGGEGQHCNFPGNAREEKKNLLRLTTFCRHFCVCEIEVRRFCNFFLVAQKKKSPTMSNMNDESRTAHFFRGKMGIKKSVGLGGEKEVSDSAEISSLLCCSGWWLTKNEK